MMIRSKFLAIYIFCLTSIVLFGSATCAFGDDGYSEKPGTQGNGDFTIGPDYKTDPDLTDRGNPKGKSFQFSMRLANSKIFPGDDSTPLATSRTARVWSPS